MAGAAHDLTTVQLPVADLRTYHRNPRKGDPRVIAESLTVNGQYRPIVVNAGTHTGRPAEVLAGNHTLMAARDLGWETVAAVTVDVDDDQAARIVAADNRTADLATYDDRLLAELLADLPDLDGTGYDLGDLEALEASLLEGLDGDGAAPETAPVNLTERFGVPPFTVLDSRAGYWRTRKREWLGLGIRSEESRGKESGVGVVFNGAERRDPDFYTKKKAAEARLGRTLTTAEFKRDHYADTPGSAITSGTSVFDPVLCELAYRWYCPPGGAVIDPFAGGSVRGVVAAALGRRYYGGELRAEQVAANESQWERIAADGHLPADAPPPVWAPGDSRTLAANLGDRGPAGDADLIFTCPPYADLEVYSDDPADLSTMPYPDFLIGYTACLRAAVDLLADDSFAVIVVGEVREKKGHGAYYGFVPDTVNVMEGLGLAYYSEHVLINMVGSAAMAANKQFTASRKAARVHQTVLVFVKGDARKAAQRGGIDAALDLPSADAVDLDDLDDEETD